MPHPTDSYIETHRESVDLTRMRPVKSTIRLQDLSVIGATSP